MVVLGSYNDWKLKHNNVCSISLDGGKQVGFEGKVISELCPSFEIVSIWNKYAGFCSFDLRERVYVERYYDEVLSKLDPISIYKKLDGKVILDYEEIPTRFVLGAWFDIMLGIDLNSYEEFSSEYYLINETFNKNIREHLENVIKKRNGTTKFHSPQANYIYNKSLKMEREASEADDPLQSEELMKGALFLRSIVDDIDVKYQNGERDIVLNCEGGREDLSGQDFWLEEKGKKLCTNLRKPYVMTKLNRQIEGQISFND